jgi:hypothetical protein
MRARGSSLAAKACYLRSTPDEQEKRLKYNDLLTNAVAIQNVIDLTRAVRSLLANGYPVKHEDLATLCPYQVDNYTWGSSWRGALTNERESTICAGVVARRRFSERPHCAGRRGRVCTDHRSSGWKAVQRRTIPERSPRVQLWQRRQIGQVTKHEIF